MKRERDDSRKQLELVNTPSLKMELGAIEEVLLEKKGQTLFIKITNTSAKYVRPEVFAIEMVCILTGHDYLHTHPGPPESFGLNPREHHTIEIVGYRKTYPDPFQLLVPTKRNVREELKGKEFRCKLVAYGGSQPSTLEFHFGVDDQALWAKEEGSAVIMSHVRTLASRASAAIHKELTE